MFHGPELLLRCDRDELVLVLLANKLDLIEDENHNKTTSDDETSPRSRAVSREEGMALAGEINAVYFEASALTSDGM